MTIISSTRIACGQHSEVNVYGFAHDTVMLSTSAHDDAALSVTIRLTRAQARLLVEALTAAIGAVEPVEIEAVLA